MCDKYGILLIINEGRTTIGRTGAILTSQTCDINPDLVILGKGIANGYELGCVVINHSVVQGLIEDTWNAIEINPISCAAAVATLNVIKEQDLLINCREMGDRLLIGMQDLKQKFPAISEVKDQG
jgi:4-aminobutyrate aminotransferase